MPRGLKFYLSFQRHHFQSDVAVAIIHVAGTEG
jgi:hypothetical protein